jgi:hypothetical protein
MGRHSRPAGGLSGLILGARQGGQMIYVFQA